MQLFSVNTDFEYVVRKPKQQKICFGSGQSRDTSKKGASPFMKYYILEDDPNIGPGCYNILESFNAIKTKPCSHSISKKGYSGLARFGKSTDYLEEYPSPSNYNVSSFPKHVKLQKYPFGSTSERKGIYVNKNPGSGMYVSKEIKGITFQHSFGGRVKMQLGVDLKCCSRNTDTCKMCGKKPTGDYWHLNNKIFLCRMCMTREFQEQVKFKKRELELFRKIRDCSGIHIHEGTDAKIWLMHPAIIKQWTRRETYLSAYLKD
ncbi:uncharacterized protein LOC114945172 isoform X1 [Nylanderia fulva]|uniref:uncharacterized protein LOC114945172 isoform X1 n=2 Tax=Nylanderia fulva TaxID=613905 RepID=UPI0010FB8C69|nr:uncharacterized protein LOC114945172 isoform X1 [Nylanderia fulva]XP_029177094.1 uncharacterized protein LOC114945172 isoform X1 [Nylanderia fulva]